MADERSLTQRIEMLERWREQAESRVRALEGRLGGATTISSDARVDVTPGPLLTVVVSNKRFDPSDLEVEKYEDHIWWDVEYTAVGLSQPARSIKGVLLFCDLFGDPQFEVRMTIDDPIQPGETRTDRGVGITYNDFTDSHKWLLGTDLSKMTFRFDAKMVLYEDGTIERLGS